MDRIDNLCTWERVDSSWRTNTKTGNVCISSCDSLTCSCPESHNSPGTPSLDLSFCSRPASPNFFRGRSTIIGWPACHDIINVDLLSIDAMMGKYLIKELPAGPNERFAVASLLMARRFS